MRARFLCHVCRGLSCLAIQILLCAPATAQVERISVATDGTQANGASGNPSISGNARFVVFTSTASNLTPEATAGTFIRDRQLGQTIPLPNSLSTGWPSVSSDGRYVLYEAAAGWTVLDRQTSDVKLITPIGGAPTVENKVLVPRLSADGRHVAFLSDVRPPAPGDVLGLFVVNLDSGVVCSAHRASDGTPGDLPLTSAAAAALVPYPSISDDGRLVAYASRASNLVPDDTNGALDGFVHDCESGTTLRVVVGTALDTRLLAPVALSGNGRRVAVSTFGQGFRLAQARLEVFDIASGANVFSSPISGSSSASPLIDFPTLNVDGRVVASISRPDSPGVFGVSFGHIVFPPPVPARDFALGSSAATPISLSADGSVIAFQSAAADLVSNDTNGVSDVFVFDRDLDGDTMLEHWETFFGLNPIDDTDGVQDADGDGVTNAQEHLTQTHPKNIPTATRYFAEGAQSGNFLYTELYLANPAPSPAAKVVVRYLHTDGSVRSQLVEVTGEREQPVQVLQGGEFSIVIESDTTLIADRQMSWPFGNRYGSHAETGILSPSPTWYLAEGSTVGAFDLFYLLQNPGTLPSEVRVRYLLPSGSPIERTYIVPPSSRFNIWVDQIPELASSDVSASIEVLSGPAIIVERSMYLSTPSRLFNAGHGGAGAVAPALEWTFAEGATGSFFDLFVLVANPNAIPAAIEASYLLVDGRVLQKSYVVPANSRFTIWVDEEEFAGVKELANVGVSTVIRSTTPVVVERAMWWPGSATEWEEAHVSVGATMTARRWGVGYVRPDSFDYDSFVLIANRSEMPGQVRVTFLQQTEEPIVQTYSLLPTSRFSIWLQDVLPDVDGNLGVLIEAIDPVDLVVERSNYFDFSFATTVIPWASGDNALATPLP